MAKLKVHNPPKIKLKSSGYMGEPTGEIEIFENGNWNVKPYATAKVRVPQPSGQAPIIIANGTYNIYDYATVEVNIPPNVKLKNITQNGTYVASSEEVDGYSTVIVDVQPLLMVKNISENGIYVASSEEVDGYSTVIVDVQLPLQEKTVSPSQIEQEVTPDSGIYGLSKVTVSGALLQNKTVTPNSSQQTIQPDSGFYGLAEILVLAAGLPIDPESLIPLEFGVDSEGFYYTDEVGGGTPISFGRDSVGIYVKGGQ